MVLAYARREVAVCHLPRHVGDDLVRARKARDEPGRDEEQPGEGGREHAEHAARQEVCVAIEVGARRRQQELQIGMLRHRYPDAAQVLGAVPQIEGLVGLVGLGEGRGPTLEVRGLRQHATIFGVDGGVLHERDVVGLEVRVVAQLETMAMLGLTDQRGLVVRLAQQGLVELALLGAVVGEVNRPKRPAQRDEGEDGDG